MQALLENEDLRGVITEDPDILSLNPAFVLRDMRGRDVECLSAADFCSRRKKLVAQ